MKNKYKKPLIVTFSLLILIALISFLAIYLVKFNEQSLFFINGFGFKNYSSINIVKDEEYKITSKDEINFNDVDVKFYANANFKYEINDVPCDFMDIYDLESFEKGEGKNINSAFEIRRSDDSIIFIKNKTLTEIIEFYKDDCVFTSSFSLNVDYYRCELSYNGELISFTFGEAISGINLGNTEVIF